MTRWTGHNSHRRAFTLVEVLVTLTIVGIMAGIVVPSMLSSQSLVIQAAARSVVADILNAQNDAVAHQSSRGVLFDAANNLYEVTDGHGTVMTAPWMSGGSHNYMVSFATDARFAGVRLVKADFGGSNQVVFDDLGSPESGGVVDLSFKQWKFQITVSPFTGRVTVKRVDAF